MKLAIIGTAGRGPDAKLLDLRRWFDMKIIIREFIKTHGIKEVISGGAAWADHLAVRLFNANLVEKLTLALPCDFIDGKFADTGVFDSSSNPGGTANYYHKNFSKIAQINSLDDIALSIKKGATIKMEFGFLNRNKIVAAEATGLIAFTFGNKQIVKDGGTAHTTRLFINKNGNESAYHVDLHELKVYERAELDKNGKKP